MTKFKNYINEKTYGDLGEEIVSKFIEHVRKNGDMRIVREMAKTGFYFSRYMGRAKKDLILDKKTQTDRISRDTPPDVHKEINNWFEKEFGWRARSENVLFVWSPYSLNRFTNPDQFIVIPNKVEKIIASEYTTDLYNVIEVLPINSSTEQELEELKYKEYSIQQVFKIFSKLPMRHELMIKCKQYSGIRQRTLKNWGYERKMQDSRWIINELAQEILK